MDWSQHAAHRRQIVEDEKQWVGLLDQDGMPLMDMPPIIELEAPETRNAPASLRMKVLARTPQGYTHRIADELVGQDLGAVDADGQLRVVKNNSRLVCVERAGQERRAFKVTHVIAEGGEDGPVTLEIHGVDLLDMLGGLPCPSVPDTWDLRWQTLTKGWLFPFTGKTYSRPRKTSDVKLAAVATGYTLSGQADVVIHTLIGRSLRAAYRLVGLPEQRWPLVMEPLVPSSTAPNLMVRPQDKYIWEEVGPAAMASGVTVSVALVFPGEDGHPGGRETPVGVVRVAHTPPLEEGAA